MFRRAAFVHKLEVNRSFATDIYQNEFCCLARLTKHPMVYYLNGGQKLVTVGKGKPL